MAMFAQNKKKNPIASILVLQFLFSPVLMDYRWSLQHDELCFLWRVGSSTWSVTFRVEMRGRTLAKFDKMISQDRLVGVEGDSVGLRGRQHLLSMKNRAAAEGKVREHVPPLRERGAKGRRRGSHMDSNSSMRCFVLPCRIWRSVLYLSRPAFTFSACSTSFCVFLVSSLAWANSELNVWEIGEEEGWEGHEEEEEGKRTRRRRKEATTGDEEA